MREFLAAVLGGLVVALVFVFVLPQPLAPAGPGSGAREVPPPVADTYAVSAELPSLGAAADESASAAADAARRVLDQTRSDLGRRVAALEAELEGMRRLRRFRSWQEDESGEAVVCRLEGLESGGSRGERILLGMALVESALGLLEANPKHPKARELLTSLCRGYAISGQAARVPAAMAEYGPRTGLPPGELAALQLDALGFLPEVQVKVARRGLQYPQSRRDRLRTLSLLRLGLQNLGRYDEALDALEREHGMRQGAADERWPRRYESLRRDLRKRKQQHAAK